MSNLEKVYQKYLRHQKGLALLLFWMEQWKSLNTWTWSDSQLKLSDLVSQRFVLGTPRPGRKTKSYNAFLGAQKEECAWLKRIEWERCILEKETQCLWLISATQRSPDVSWPDLPAIAVGVYIDPLEKLGSWTGPRLDLRGVWWDENNEFYVDNAPTKTLGVTVGSLDSLWTKKERQNIETLHDIVMKRLNNSNVDFDPGFIGDTPLVPQEFSDFIKPFDPKSVERPANADIEFNYPELFGQFLEEQEKKKKSR